MKTLLVSILFVAGYFSYRNLYAHNEPVVSAPMVVTKDMLARAFAEPLDKNEFPPELDLRYAGETLHSRVHYTFDTAAQTGMTKLMKSYAPDYGAFVAMDAKTGEVLTLVSFSRGDRQIGNIALKATFPAASIFKIVTATAAIDDGQLTPDTIINFRGANHTLYRRNVTEDNPRRLERHMTIREAFAKSVNTVFARLGIFFLKPLQLQRYAERFHFNRDIATDLPVQPGSIIVPDNDPWAIGEVASGFNRVAQMSPVQGAMIAAAVVNDGVMMAPFVVSSLDAGDGAPLYQADPKASETVMSPESALEIRAMMRETIHAGTSRKAFRDFFRRKFAKGVDVGGKTGSLTGLTPRGKYDWFVGYGQNGEKRIAVGALTINEENWRVKSSYLARVFFEQYFKRLEDEK